MMRITRLNRGDYVLAPTGNSWESLGTSNSGGVFLNATSDMLRLLSGALEQDITNDAALRDGLVVSLYTANGTTGEDPVRRQRKGLAVFTPSLELRCRKPSPVLSPDTRPGAVDSLGIEDARVTYHDGQFSIWYCGYNGERGMPCAAHSRDLLTWVKQVPLPGDIGEHENKDHVIFPEAFAGKWWMLHRPWGREIPDANDYVIRLASAPSLLGPWMDEGELLRGLPSPDKRVSWVGGGAPPLKIGEGRYFVLYHNGCFLRDGRRRYEGCAAIVDLNALRNGNARRAVTHRLEPFFEPETRQETHEGQRIDIVFPMSAHVWRDDLYFLYGAGDTATCAARVDFGQALRLVEQAPAAKE